MLRAVAPQNTAAANITSGTINNAAIGGTTPSSGAFTTLSATGVATLTVVNASGAIASTTTVRTGGFTVAGLPAGTIGMRTYVTDALTPTYLAAVAGGGAVVTPVFFNGTGWITA